jgi:hypothetical protein
MVLDDNAVYSMFYPSPPPSIFMWDTTAKVLQSKEADEEIEEPPSPHKSAIERKRKKKKKKKRLMLS